MNIDMSTVEGTQVYHLMTQTIVPRPIAWVLTESGSENFNLAPFSYFTAVSSTPPLLMFSVGNKPDGQVKDTVRNLTRHGEMVIHIASADLADQVTQTAATLPHGESEVTIAKLELTDMVNFPLPRVSRCPIAFACSLYDIKTVGDAPQQLVFAKIEHAFIDDSIIEDHQERVQIDTMQLNPLCRLGGANYAVLDKTFSVARPK
ncbi:flavin reductase family protein [Vibrio panuliri]|uniref:Protein/domain typically associated with flavoprotein oxygenase, DIM6/NTAB family protein n=1 Tax=Vibrio panuliri TaxID=1381081 RepID=A0ABX3FDI7_9VIBR|nr:flavin reductase family protein [Vibrio panuliri]KAB1454480.1 flavin reductase family protein [Vibrio panuliri]OLQ90018.1 protein/domain typically associated with flavoprotein oxygenase, DIM6/NTAB family protein [Vibrio panuliri]